MKKILLVNGSPRPSGSTHTLMDEIARGIAEAGGEILAFSVAGKDIRPCLACEACRKGTGGCVQQDDIQEYYRLFRESDAVIYGSPVYCMGMTAQAKIVMDRGYALGEADTRKIRFGAVVATAGSNGLVDVVKDYLMNFVSHGIIPIEWLASYEVGIFPDSKAMKQAYALGRRITELAGEWSGKLPDVRSGHIAFGTHTI